MKRVSAELTSAEIENIHQLIKDLKATMPFLISLTKEERMTIPKIGDKNFSFVKKAISLVGRETAFLPRSFDIEEFRKDFELHQALFSIKMQLATLHKSIEDTMIASGNEAYNAALSVYRSAKNSVGDVITTTQIKEMGKAFVRKAQKRENSHSEEE